ncbi:MAG: hypothetical protein OHK0017_00840 [Patescibacteria group bacterium]
MHPILEEYYWRFASADRPELKISKFFTSYGENFEEELPYIYFIQEACERLAEAWINSDKICIYSDYDTDAVTAAATMYWGLIELGFKTENISFYAPDRFTEGYGVNGEALSKLALQNDLIITVDCGINSVDEANRIVELKNQHANDQNQKVADLIITDHHQLTGELPTCVAVINPRVQNLFKPEHPNYFARKNYLSESVTGVGVAWFSLVWLGYWLKFKMNSGIQQLSTSYPAEQLIVETKSLDLKNLNNLLPFVAIGTVADCQSILEPTNRMLVRAGIKIMQAVALNQKPIASHRGLFNLLQITGLSQQCLEGYQITSSDLAFNLSPVLNSAGRMSHAMLSIQALVGNQTEAKEQALALVAENNKRKLETKRILESCENEALVQVENGAQLIWLGSSDWSKGLIGLLASRLVASHQLPVVVLELPHTSNDGDIESNEKVSASLRAPDGYNLPEAMSSISNLFLKFGGHPGAAGFSAKFKDLTEIKKSLSVALESQNTVINTSLKTDYLAHKVDTNILAKLEQWRHLKQSLWLSEQLLYDEQFWKDLDALEPFGIDLPNPILIFKSRIDSVQYLSENKHLKLNVGNDSGLLVQVLKFNLNDSELLEFQKLKTGDEALIIGRMNKNAWKNKITRQIIAEQVIRLTEI